MTRYNVHVYREMRLVFEGIEADSHEEAASLARNRATSEADEIDDCEGESFAALVDVVDDTDHEHSRLIAFEGDRLLKAAPAIEEALRDCIRQIHALLPIHQQSDSTLDNIPAVIKARAALVAARAGQDGR